VRYVFVRRCYHGKVYIGWYAARHNLRSSYTCTSSSSCSTVLTICNDGACGSPDERNGTAHVSSIVPADLGGAAPSGGTEPGGSTTNPNGGGTTNPNGSVTDPVIEASTGYVANSKLASTTAGTDGIMKILKIAINILSGAVLVAAVIMLIIAAIQYSSAGGEPNGVKAAKTKITNVLIGVVAYVFLYAFMNWLIPGGLVTSI
jgi:hypothetical protein